MMGVKVVLAGLERSAVTKRKHASMALVSVAHRIGRDALLAEMARVARPEEPKETREGVTDDLLAQPASKPEEYFALFYRGLRPADVARMFPQGGRRWDGTP